jgi:WD40 repeat protein
VSPKVTLAGIFGLSLLGLAQSSNGERPSISSYALSFYDPGKAFGNMQELVVLPAGARPISVPLPFGLGYMAPSPDGKALYAARFFDPARSNIGLYKIEFGPTRATPVAGSEGLFSIYGIGVSRTKIVVSAGYLNSAGLLDEKSCGLFELTLASGKVRKILSNSNCKYKSSWGSISLSPDGEQLVAVREHRMMLVNLGTGDVRSLGEGFFDAAWSPDGLWIAALEYGGRSRTVLMDTSNFSKQRELPSSEVIWSPDSRYIVAVSQQSRCGEYSGTLQLIDIKSGEKSTVPGSACKVTHTLVGWVNVAGQ